MTEGSAADQEMAVTEGGAHVVPGEEPGEKEIRMLGELRVKYAQHRILRQEQAGRPVRYHAYGVTVVVHPHTIITKDLAELDEELARVYGKQQGETR